MSWEIRGYHKILQYDIRIQYLEILRVTTRNHEILQDIIFYELQRGITRYYRILRDIIFYEMYFARFYEISKCEWYYVKLTLRAVWGWRWGWEVGLKKSNDMPLSYIRMCIVCKLPYWTQLHHIHLHPPFLHHHLHHLHIHQ